MALISSTISELLFFTLDRLHKEPELLRVDAERIRRRMQEVAVGNYRAFIAAANALTLIKDQLTSFDKHLDLLITEIPNISTGCGDFIDSAQHILEAMKVNQTLLANHSTLLDLLEIPQLMDTLYVVYPYCATSFGRCYPNGATIITESRSIFNGLSQLVNVTSVTGIKNAPDNKDDKSSSGNVNAGMTDNGSPVDGEETAIGSNGDQNGTGGPLQSIAQNSA